MEEGEAWQYGEAWGLPPRPGQVLVDERHRKMTPRVNENMNNKDRLHICERNSTFEGCLSLRGCGCV